MLRISKAAPREPRKGAGPEDPVTEERAIGQAVYRALRAVARDLPDAVLEKLDARAITVAVPWDRIAEDLETIADPLEKVIVRTARAEIPKKQLAKAAGLPLDADPVPIEFALINQMAVQYAAQHSGSLIMDLSAGLRETVATILSGSVAGNLPRHAVVDLLRATIPLHSSWAQAVEKVYDREYTKRLQAGATLDKAAEFAKRAADVRSDRLLQTRSRNIARTEAMRAMNEGKFAGWSQQVAEGWMPVDSLKEWQEGRSPCKRCEPLVGQIVPWDQPFSNGQMMPPEHPSCRCTAIMLPPDDEFLEIMEQQRAAASGFITDDRPLAKTTSGEWAADKDFLTDFTREGGPMQSAIQNGADMALADIWKRQGFSRSATLVDRIDPEDAGAIFRGVQAQTGTPPASVMIDQFKHGEEPFAGTGIFGNGSYFTNRETTALGYSGGVREQVIRARWKPNANLLYFDTQIDFMTWYQRVVNESFPPLQAAHAAGQISDAEFNALRGAFMDPGRTAAMLGVDGYRVGSGQIGEDYWIVQNRAALEVER
jgi:hypothetical protein